MQNPQKMYTVEISNVCAETICGASTPRQALQNIIKANKLPFVITKEKEIKNVNQKVAKVSLLGGVKESISYYVLENN